MSALPVPALEARGPLEQLRLARQVVRAEGQTLLTLADRLGDDFCQAMDVLSAARGSVIVSGMGKAGLIGQKIAATLASTGTPAFFVHPSEASHGDLGMIIDEDVIFAWAVFESREARDVANEKIAADPRMAKIMDPDNPIFDCKRIAHGGFRVIVHT